MDNQTLSKKPQYGYGFIYCYTSPSGKKYIGQTRTTLKHRAGVNGKHYQGCSAFHRAIEKYGWENFQVEILEEVPLDVIDETEINYILDYNTVDPKFGYNIMQERCKYMATLRHIPVYSYDEFTGKFLESYSSISEAERAMNVHAGSIRRALNQLNHHVKQKTWMTEKFDQIEVVPKNVQATSKKVYMYDSKTGEYLQEFGSLRAAAKETAIPRSYITTSATTENIFSKYPRLFRFYKVECLSLESSTTNSSEKSCEMESLSMNKESEDIV